MATILMSIKPKYVEKIMNGTKKYEYRKILPNLKIDKIIIYSSSPVKKVVGEVTIKSVLRDKKEIIYEKTKAYGGISKEDYFKYYKDLEYATVFEVDKVIKYEKEKELTDYNIKYAPQSYIYIK